MNRQHLLVMLTSRTLRGAVYLPVKIRGLTADERQEYVTRWSVDPLAAQAWLVIKSLANAKGEALLIEEDAAGASDWNKLTLARTIDRILAAPSEG